jgi:sulfide:quinone oxidoreductase
MSTERISADPFNVVVAGGGVAALEATLALKALAGDLVTARIVAPNEDFVYRPTAVCEPFGYRGNERYSLQEIADDIGVELVGEAVASIESSAQIVSTESSVLHYDALLLAVGARPHPRYRHVVTLDDRILDEQLHGLVQDVEDGYTTRLAFVIPGRMAWPLPIYELALMTAGRAYDMNVELSITVITPEEAPLAIFGGEASRRVSRLLASSQIDVITSAYAEVRARGLIEVRPGDRSLKADRIVSLPELSGPTLRGLPTGEHGFIPVDSEGKVRGLERVYAVGDATEFPIKHGGIAAHQADVSARAIAALAGAAVERTSFTPELRGLLLTGGKPLFLKARITGGQGSASEVSEDPLWDPPMKVSARYLGPYLQHRQVAASPR